MRGFVRLYICVMCLTFASRGLDNFWSCWRLCWLLDWKEGHVFFFTVLIGRLARCSYHAPFPAGDALRRLGEIEVPCDSVMHSFTDVSNLRDPGPFVQ